MIEAIGFPTFKLLLYPKTEYLISGSFGPLGHILAYLSGIMGNQRLTFFIILGLYRDYTSPKRLKVTYSTTRIGNGKGFINQRPWVLAQAAALIAEATLTKIYLDWL